VLENVVARRLFYSKAFEMRFGFSIVPASNSEPLTWSLGNSEIRITCPG
jgi:hypothetical protein